MANRRGTATLIAALPMRFRKQGKLAGSRQRRSIDLCDDRDAATGGEERRLNDALVFGGAQFVEFAGVGGQTDRTSPRRDREVDERGHARPVHATIGQKRGWHDRDNAADLKIISVCHLLKL